MFGWLRQKAADKIIQSHSAEMMPWLRQLCSLSDEDVAAIYLAALSIRNITHKTTGIDMMNMSEALERDKALALRFGSQIRDAQKSSLYNLANGFKVWIFTIRSIMHPELRPIGLGIWQQLRRGLPHVHSLANEIFARSGHRSDLSGLGLVPVEFEGTGSA